MARDFYDLIREKAGFDPNDPAAVQERVAQINEASDPLLILPADWQDPRERIATVPPGSPSPAMDGLEFSDPNTISPAPVEVSPEPEPEAAPATGDFYDRIRARGTSQPLPYQDSPLDPGVAPADAPLEEEDIEGDPTWADYGRRWMSGNWANAAGMGFILERLGETMKDDLPEYTLSHTIGKGLDAAGEALMRMGIDKTSEWLENLSPTAKVALEQEYLGEAITSESRFNRIKLDVVGSLSGTMLGMGMGMIFTKALQKAANNAAKLTAKQKVKAAGYGAMVGFGAGEALVAAPTGAAFTQDEIRQMPLEQLMQSTEFMANLMSFDTANSTLSAEEKIAMAREMTARMAANEQAAITLVTTFMLSAPFGKVLDKLLWGGAATAPGLIGRTTGMAKGAGVEGFQEFLQSGSEQVAENFAMWGVDPTMGPEQFGRGVLEAALGGLGAGAMMGAGPGFRLTPEAAKKFRDQASAAQIEKLKLLQEEMERRQYESEEGRDLLEKALDDEGRLADAAAFAQAVVADLDTLVEEAEETASARQRAKRPNPMFKEGEKTGPGTKLSDEEIAAEIETELEREQLQKEAGERYAEQKKRLREEEQAFEQRDAELEKQKDRDIAAAEGQVELQRAEQLERESDKKPSGKVRKVKDKESGRYKTVSEVEPEVESKATLGELGLKAAKAASLAGRRILEAAKNVPAMLTDQRPSTIVVDPSGASRPMTAAEFESQVRRRWDAMEQMDLPIEERRIPVQVQGLELEIENPKGSTRKGKRKDGSVWSRLFRGVHYGAINKTQGADGEKLDVYIGGQDWRATGQKVWVVNQYNEDGTFDEHKVMLGFANQAEAVNAFNLHKASDMTQGEVSEMTIEEFRTWALDGKTKNQPLISDTGTLAASEADIEAMRERARAKGLKPPKIMYAQQEPETVSDTLKKYVNKAGNLVLTHFSRAVGLNTLDPNMGPSRYSAEGKRAGAFPGSWVARVAFGIGVGKPGGYQKESMLGSEKYQTEVRPEELYDLEGDPDGLRARIPKDSNPAERTNLYEKAVRDAGYRGYWVNDPSRGPMAVLFESVPVSGKKTAKPKILYKDPKLDIVIEEWEGEMDWEDDPGLGIQEQDYLDPNVRIYQARVNGRVVANMAVEDMWSPKRGEYAQIRWTFTQQTMRGKDVGKELLMGAIEAANKRGLEIVSDSSVSAAQLLVYDSLQRKGKIAIEFSDPARAKAIIAKAKEVGLQNLPSDMKQLISEKPDPDTNGVVPVVSRIVALEYAEDVQYQKEQRNETLRWDTNEDVRNIIDHLLEWMPGIDSTRVFILDDVSELKDTEKHGPYYYNMLLEKENGLATPGFHDSANNRIYVILNNHKYPANAISTFMHEATAHYGLRKVFGKDMDRLLDKIYAGADKALMREIRKYGSVESGGTKETGYKFDLRTVQGRRDAVEEMIAHAAEKNQNRSWLQEVVHFIREILRKVGILDSWTDTDILFLLRDIRRELRSTPLDKIEILAQAEIEETGEVVQLRQPADVALRRHDKRVAVLEKLRECVG